MTLKYAIDCETVGCVSGSCLARVSIVNQLGCCVFDEYVKPTAKVTDYRNITTDIKKKYLENGSDIAIVRVKVRDLIKEIILIGHFLKFDLDALNLSHPEIKQRDLAVYEPFLTVKYFFIRLEI